MKLKEDVFFFGLTWLYGVLWCFALLLFVAGTVTILSVLLPYNVRVVFLTILYPFLLILIARAITEEYDKMMAEVERGWREKEKSKDEK